jgi:hypothetical protein
MKWNYWLPWREYPQKDSKDSTRDSKVIEGDGPKRILVNESEQEPPYGTED